jgi:hypothetical protein
MKRVDETTAGQSISAFVIISPENKLIAKVQAYYSKGGTVTVNVFNWGEGESFQEGKAGGWGYDKFTAAIRGMVIDGHEITDHCQIRLEKPTEQGFPRDFETPKGYSLANYRDGFYNDCYKDAGLDYLRHLGYSVIQAI